MSETMVQTLLNATVVSREDLNSELFIVRVRPDSGEVPEFEPGQFSMLGVPSDDVSEEQAAEPSRKRKITKRAYSIASSPENRDYLEFFIVLIDDGRLTPKLWDLHPGDRVWMDTRISGKFSLEPVPSDKDLVMFATGTGLAPFVSMIRKYHGTGRWRHYVLIHGARTVSDLGYQAELEALSHDDPSIIYLPCVTREPENSDWKGLRGRVTDLLEPATFESLTGFPLDPEECYVFLCGNPEMIKFVEKTLSERGFQEHTRKSPGNLHFERYW